MAFVAAGGLWYLKIGVLVVVLLGGGWLVWRLRKRPVWAVPAGLVWVLVVLVLVSIKAPTRRDMYGDPRLEVSVAQHDAVLRSCEPQLAALPSTIAVESVVDTVTGLDMGSLVRLLVHRRLAFVEIKVQQVPGKPAYIVRSRSPTDPAWTVNQAAGSYAHIDLTERSSGTCTPEAELPVLLLEELRFAPLPADQCLRLRPTPKPTARHQLVYQNDPTSPNGLLGFFRLVDNQGQQLLAQLPTVDKPHQVTSEMGVGKPNPAFQRPGCREPFMALMDKLVRVGQSIPGVTTP